jgi:hypothetical protein
MSCRASESGLSAVELLIVLCVAGTVAAMTVPASTAMVNEFSVSGDAHGVSNSIAVARMGAAANFTRQRLYVDRAANRYRVERWNKAAGSWQPASGESPLGSLNTFSAGTIAAPPPNSTAAVTWAPLCRDDAGADIADTACVIFNSRGLPVDAAGLPAAVSALYVSGPTAVFAIVVSSTSQLAMWRVSPGGGAWVQK